MTFIERLGLGSSKALLTVHGSTADSYILRFCGAEPPRSVILSVLEQFGIPISRIDRRQERHPLAIPPEAERFEAKWRPLRPPRLLD